MDYPEIKEIFAEVLPIIYRAAPIIGSFLGTPATGTILAVLAAVVQESPCDHCALAEKLKNDPRLYEKLAALESTHADWVKKLT